jgi:hypothetical protein
MTRQQYITQAQVAEKIRQANSRVDRLISQAPHATSDAEFDSMLKSIAQGISDAAAWTTCLAALEMSEPVAA